MYLPSFSDILLIKIILECFFFSLDLDLRYKTFEAFSIATCGSYSFERVEITKLLGRRYNVHDSTDSRT